MKIYQVGGAVRDKLLGRLPHDIDYVVVGTTPEKMKELGFKEIGRGFPVFLHCQTGEEYALARKEIKTGSRHTDFRFIFDESVTLREDLERRDFTCNAIAYDDSANRYIDYFNGRQDIENKILRHINAQHFVEDPLRVLRLCRFAAQLNFTAAPETIELCVKMTKDGMLQHLTIERIWNEIFKALQSDAFYRFIELAGQIGVLQIILPEVKVTDDLIMALRSVTSKSALVNFAALMHGISEIQTPLDVSLSSQEYENHAKKLIYKICRRLKVPNYFRTFAVLAVTQCIKFPYILQMCPDVLYDLAASMNMKHTCYVEEYVEVCRIAAVAKHQMPEIKFFEQSADKLRQACRIIASVKATQMPNYEQLPKDKSFKWHLRKYKLKELCRQLDFT